MQVTRTMRTERPQVARWRKTGKETVPLVPASAHDQMARLLAALKMQLLLLQLLRLLVLAGM